MPRTRDSCSPELPRRILSPFLILGAPGPPTPQCTPLLINFDIVSQPKDTGSSDNLSELPYRSTEFLQIYQKGFVQYFEIYGCMVGFVSNEVRRGLMELVADEKLELLSKEHIQYFQTRGLLPLQKDPHVLRGFLILMTQSHLYLHDGEPPSHYSCLQHMLMLYLIFRKIKFGRFRKRKRKRIEIMKNSWVNISAGKLKWTKSDESICG